MTAWYAPLQLLRTGRDVAVSTLFGQSDDRRLYQHLAWREYEHYDLSKKGEIVIDYVADTGDGFDSTYAVQWWMTRERLELDVPHEKEKVILPRGELLVFGGDEVYPTPMGHGYEERLIAPMRAACGKSQPEGDESKGPWCFAIPGNHDWYDNLAAFTHVFITKKSFCMWHAPQRRSYFAIALPHDWWIVGPDVQLASEIDDVQMEFFRHVGEKMGPHAKVILCNAEPHWIYEHDAHHPIQSGNLYKLERLIGRKIRVWIAGDLHHYRHFANDAGVHKITAGGGGAFLHPTHGWRKPPLEGGFKHQKSFPTESQSWWLTMRNLIFPVYNPTFGVLTALVYALIGWNVLAALRPDVTTASMKSLLLGSVTTPGGASWYATIIAAFIVFTDTSKIAYRVIAGSAHAVAHLLTMLFGVWISCVLYTRFQTPQHVVFCIAILLALGFFVAPLWMGAYLCISLNVFKRHRNEAFSALRIPDWKNFLRITIDSKGSLRIFPIGIRKVPRKWKKQGATWIPDDPSATDPQLIEGPIVIE